MCAIVGKAEGPRARHHLRHGRHHGQARRGRWRDAGHHADVRDRPRALQEGQRPADQCAGRRDDRDRRRRRQHRARRQGHDRRRARQRRRRSRPDLLRARRHASRRSPTPTWCWATSRPTGSMPAPCGSTPRRRTSGHQGQDRRSARHLGAGSRVGHPSHRDVEHGERAAHRLGRARARSAALRHGGVRRRGSAACGAAGAVRRHSDRSSCPMAPASARRSACWRPIRAST